MYPATGRRQVRTVRLIDVPRKTLPTRRDAGRPRGAAIQRTVLASVLEEISENGVEALSVERVARRSDVNKTTIYRRWPTRESLIAAALEGFADQLGASVPDTGSLAGDLSVLIKTVSAMVGQPAGLALLRAALSSSTQLSVSKLARSRVGDATKHPITLMVSRARARGEWREGVRIEQLVFTMVGAILHRALMEQIGRSVV